MFEAAVTVFLAQGWAEDRLVWGILVCLVGGVLSVLGRRALRPDAGWVLFVFCMSAGATLGIIYFRRPVLAPVPQIAWTCAVVSLVWSIVAAGTRPRRKDLEPASIAARLHHSSVFALSALLFGVIAIIIQTVVLVMRMIFVTIDLFRGYPGRRLRQYGFSEDGLWPLLILLVSCGIGLFAARNRKLVTCLLWIGVIFVVWYCLLAPPFTTHVTGGFERSPMTVWMTASLAGLLFAAVAIMGCIDQRNQGNTLHNHTQAFERLPPPPGFVSSCAILAAIVLLLGCYHLLVPVRFPPWGYRTSLGMVAASSALAACATVLLVSRSWNEGLADAAFGLSSLAMCSVAILAVPFGTAPLSDLYPMIFNAMILGLAVSTGIWTYLSNQWRLQLDSGMTWTTAGRLIPHAKRGAFLSAALALVAGALMTYWPRIPTVAGMDHTIGRITAGFAAHLFLLLVMLWCSRRLRRLTFHLLTILAVFSTAGFIVVRMIPFASRLE